jgi:hypothetical protein
MFFWDGNRRQGRHSQHRGRLDLDGCLARFIRSQQT